MTIALLERPMTCPTRSANGRRTTKIFVLCAAILVVLFGATALVWRHYYSEACKDALAGELAVRLLVRHLEREANHWPKTWDDLREDYWADPAAGTGFPFEEVRKRVVVNWDLRPTELFAICRNPGAITPVRLRNGAPIDLRPLLEYLQRAPGLSRPPSTSTVYR